MTKTQQTIKKSVTLSGIGLHTGNRVTLTIHPAPVDVGIVFERADLDGKPRVEARVENVVETTRGTTLGKGTVKVHTVEHVLSALAAFGVDNARVEMSANEPPIGDGSAQPFVELIEKSGIQTQSAEKQIFVVTEPLTLNVGDSMMIALPLDGANPGTRTGAIGSTLRVSCTQADSKNKFVQFLSLDVTLESYLKEVAPARTFCVYEEVEALFKNGLIKGGSLETAIIIRDDAVLTKGALRFADEFVRHKILDIIGDLSLLGQPLAAHVIAIKPGHTANAAMTKALSARRDGRPEPFGSAQGRPGAKNVPVETLGETLNAEQIRKILPHRYPFLLVDRIVKIEGDEKIIGLKNVTNNEPYFQGHFPGHPIMPGVLQIEAMAQVGGILLMKGGKYNGMQTYLLSVDKAKFRRPVVPGDQLMIECQLLRSRGSTMKVGGVAKVSDEIVSEAELMFAAV